MNRKTFYDSQNKKMYNLDNHFYSHPFQLSLCQEMMELSSIYDLQPRLKYTWSI